MPAASWTLQGFSAGEPVRAQPALSALRLRLEAAGADLFRHLDRDRPSFGLQLRHAFEANRRAFRQVHDLELDRIEAQRCRRAQCVQRHLQVAARARDGTPALVVDDQPALVDVIDAVDYAVQREAVDRGGELPLHQIRRALESAARAESLELGEAEAPKRGRATCIGEAGYLPHVGVHRLQAFGRDGVSSAPLLAAAAQHLVQDRALYRLGAMRRRQPLPIAKPVLPRTIPIALTTAVRKNKVALVLTDVLSDLPAC